MPCVALWAAASALLLLMPGAAPARAAAGSFVGLGHPCAERGFWTGPDVRAALAGVLAKAEALHRDGIPAFDEDAYRAYARTGSRVAGDTMMVARMAALSPLVLAACVTGEARDLDRLSAHLQSLLDQPTWVLAAHDPDLKTLAGTGSVVDLHATELAGELGETLALLGDALSPTLVAEIRRALRRRVVDPVLAGARGGNGPFWLTASNNWNANCLSGFLAAALAADLSPDDRAEALRIAATDIQFYLAGFDAEGYGPEGMSYWSYGFSRFVLLRETLLEAAGPDLLADPHARLAGSFPLRFEVFPGVAAAFGDALLGQPPDAWTLAYLARAAAAGPDRPGLPLRTDLLRFAVVSLDALSAARAPVPPLPASDVFTEGRVLVSRPAPGSGGALAVTMKGRTGGPHSHDDVGSYVVFLCAVPVMGDPGGGTFYAREADARDNPIETSYGHPVPLVGGAMELASAASAAAPTVVTRGVEADAMKLDLTPAYPPRPGLAVSRTFAVARKPAPSFAVDDRVALPQAAVVDSPIVTRRPFAIAGTEIDFGTDGDEGRVSVSANTPVDLVPERIARNGIAFTRIAVRTRVPVADARIRAVYRPPPGARCPS